MSAPRGRFGQYLADALALLRRESPVHFEATRRRLGARVIGIRIVGDVPVRVRLQGDDAEGWVTRVGEPDDVAPAEVQIATSQADLDGFLRGDFTLEEGLEANRVAVRGRLDDVLAFLDGLAAWLHGALRCPSFPPLHHQFLAGAQPTPVPRPESDRQPQGAFPC